MTLLLPIKVTPSPETSYGYYGTISSGCYEISTVLPALIEVFERLRRVSTLILRVQNMSAWICGSFHITYLIEATHATAEVIFVFVIIIEYTKPAVCIVVTDIGSGVDSVRRSRCRIAVIGYYKRVQPVIRTIAVIFFDYTRRTAVSVSNSDSSGTVDVVHISVIIVGGKLMATRKYFLTIRVSKNISVSVCLNLLP